MQGRAIEVDQVVHRDIFNSVKTVTQLSMEIEDSTRRKFSITLQVTSRFQKVPLKGNRVTVSYVGSKVVGNTAHVFETRKWLSSWRRVWKETRGKNAERKRKSKAARKIHEKWRHSLSRSSRKISKCLSKKNILIRISLMQLLFLIFFIFIIS